MREVTNAVSLLPGAATVASMDGPARTHRAGRPEITSHEEIERVAFALFERLGYEETSMGIVADEVGIGRRTIFRYFPSKHDIPWGRFDRELPRLATLLEEQPAAMTPHAAVMSALASFNDHAAGSSPSHLTRMRLIIGEPSLQSHSALRYGEWRRVVAEFVAARLGCSPSDPVPRIAAYATNALAIAAYSEWIDEPEASLGELFVTSSRRLELYLGGEVAQ